MHIRRTLFTGALAVGLLCLAAAAGLCQSTQVDQQLDAVAATIKKFENKPEDQRKKQFGTAQKQLGRLARDKNLPDIQRHRAMLLQATISEKIDDNPLSNQKYTAAATYRKLIALAGPGALRGAPRDGWPNQYVHQAYDNYAALKDKVDAANRKKKSYKFIHFLVRATGSSPGYSYWLAIIIVTLLVKIITTPLSHLQFESMQNMQRLQPRIEKLRQELSDDPQEFQKQQWQLLKDNNAMPQWGCLALLVQMPFLILIYQTIRAYEFQFAKGNFLWIGSRLTENVPFIGPSLADPDWPLLLLYGISLYVSSKMSSTAAVDKAQADQQKMMALLMPAMFIVFFNGFPSAFILYWLVLNILTTTQQYFMLKKPVPALALEDDDEVFVTAEPAHSDKPAAAGPGAGRGPRPRKRK